jgi:hypothetical protein
MASIKTATSASTQTRPVGESLEQRFQRLASEWEAATGFISSMDAASKHPAYQEIISMGGEVMPLLLRDIEKNHTHWFIALEKITGANPLPSEAAGNIPRMVAAWLDWAKRNGYEW